jgi:hypothetical protein
VVQGGDPANSYRIMSLWHRKILYNTLEKYAIPVISCRIYSSNVLHAAAAAAALHRVRIINWHIL